MVALVGRARRARRHARLGVGGLSETALPYPLESPLTDGRLQSDTETNYFTLFGGRGVMGSSIYSAIPHKNPRTVAGRSTVGFDENT